MNRLAEATSPYLLQHRDNPVDWQEWGEAAFAEAKRRDVPVLLSVGYAACHWCHVMAHESFEDEGVAAVMNEHFVNVKVDREERPDVDAVYMEATQALTGSGGWPMTVFLTPAGRPFYAGTYFPPRPGHGMPSFSQLLAAINDTWTQRRDEVDAAAGRITKALAGNRPVPTGRGVPDAARLAGAVRALARDEDATYGGLGGAPKFPPSATLEFLLRHAAVTPGESGESGESGGSAELAAGLAGRTLTAMAHGGIYDQVEGGFARYSVDRAWVVPHFEKMLYDNAQLARVYLHWWRLTGAPTGARVAQETCDFLLARLRTEQGGFASSLDADTPVTGADGRAHGVEGLTYVWTPAELTEVLGPEDGAWAAELLGVTAQGSFEHGTSTARLTRDVWADPVQADRWRAVRARLRAVRTERPQPGRDDKVVAAWNGLAIAALAETGALLERPDLVEAAVAAADLMLAVHLVPAGAGEPGPSGVRLRRVSRDGAVGAPGGVLEDYADLVEGLLALHAVTGEPAWLEVSQNLLGTVLDHFGAPDGGFHDTPDDADDAALAAVRRPQDPTDNAYPGGWSAAAGALLSAAALTGRLELREAAERALGVVDALADTAPRAVGWGLAVAQAARFGPLEVAVVGPAGSPERDRLHRVALAGAAPGTVISCGEPDAPGVPLLADRGEGTRAFVCRNFTCLAPVTDPDQLAGAVLSRTGPAERGR